MIFTRDGQQIDAGFWLDFKLAMSARIRERAARSRRFYLTKPDGSRYYRVGKTKLGDPLRLFRDTTYYQPSRFDLKRVRATHGVGRPLGTRLYPPSQGGAEVAFA